MLRTAVLAALMLAGAVSAWPQDLPTSAATTRLIPFSGVHTDSAGAAVPGAHLVTFRLFDEREGGTLLWSETQVLEVDARGRYTAYLGARQALPLDIGVLGIGTLGPAAVSGHSLGSALAGQFIGNVSVTGTLTKGGGAFEIDHPLDPANKYLRHSFVESPDMMNVYNGNAVLDTNGEVWVTLPDWFEALNRDFRYQLTAIGRQANPYITEEVSGNRFKIAGGAAGGKVSWQVTGIRQDAWANTHRIAVEEDKPARTGDVSAKGLSRVSTQLSAFSFQL